MGQDFSCFPNSDGPLLMQRASLGAAEPMGTSGQRGSSPRWAGPAPEVWISLTSRVNKSGPGVEVAMMAAGEMASHESATHLKYTNASFKELCR